MDIRTDPAYWTRKIEEDGIENVEGILSIDRTSPGADIIRARNDAIKSYRSPGLVKMNMLPNTLAVASILGVIILIVSNARS